MSYLIKKTLVPFIFTFDVFGNIAFFWTRFRKKPESLKKALFIRLEHIGDMILATPAFESFKKSNPGCEVHVLCKNLTAPLIMNNPSVDKIITYDAPWFIGRDVDKKKSFLEILKELRRERYDVIFEMHGDPRNNLIAFLARGYSVGYACRGGGFLLNEMKKYDPKLQMIRQNLQLIKDFAKIRTEKTRIYNDSHAKKTVENILEKNGLQKKKFIIINPASGRKEKDLTDDEVKRFIEENRKENIIITGSKAEMGNNEKFIKHKKDIIDLTGKTSLLELAELVRNAKKVIAPDTGIIHIAKAVDADFEAVYKTTDRRVWGYE